jgi:DNA-binding response OmpR family regulator
MHFTKKEARIVEAMLKDPLHVFTIEQVAEISYGDEDRPVSWRNSTIALMTRLRLKTIQLKGRRIVRVSKRAGRGNVGKYAFFQRAEALGLKGE